MLNRFKFSYYVLTLLFLLTIKVTAQQANNLWLKSNEKYFEKSKQFKRIVKPSKYEDFELNLSELKNNLKQVPHRKNSQFKSQKTVSFPNGEGGFDSFEVYESSVLNEKLQKEYPHLKTYYGVGLVDKTSTIQFSITTMGFHGVIQKSGKSTVYIDPVNLDGGLYKVYNRANNETQETFQCAFDELTENSNINKSKVFSKIENSNDGKLRKFRLAVATTGEYAQFHLSNQNIPSTASEFDKKAAVLSAIVATVARVNSVYERDLGISLELVGNNSNIIFLDAATDNLTNDNKDNKLLDESQVVIDNVIGFNNYDIGHTFSTGAGGVASINSPCTSSKAKGITGVSNPIGDSFNIDYVAHEMGHQFGAHHTFSGDSGNCGGDNRNNGTSVEPGSGTTIMGYAGICAPQNVQTKADDYFHLVSIKEIWSNITIGSGNCATVISTSNIAPEIEALGNYTIPISTPFALNAKATDANGDNLTYTWEQLDTGGVQYPLVSTIPAGSVFRSLKPTTSPIRYFPDLATVNAGSLSNKWEVLPSVTRTMRFGVTVRDNNTAGGQTASKELNLTVDGGSGPFVVSSQSSNVTWYAGTSQKITWNVAKTNVAPVACTHVSILLSNDGGLTYPTTLATNVPNNGTYDVIVPNNVTTNGKIKVQSVNNVFYALNKGVIKIESSEFIMDFESYKKEICAPNTVEYNFVYKTFLGFNSEVTFSALSLPEGAQVVFNPVSAQVNNTAVKMTISNVLAEKTGNQVITVKGKSATIEKTSTINLDIFSNSISSPTLVSPVNNFAEMQRPYKLEWNLDPNAINATVEISTTSNFSTVLETGNSVNGTYNPTKLAPASTYYWRVKFSNNCGTSGYSTVYSFTTVNETCNTIASVDIPKKIPDNSFDGIVSVLNVLENKKIIELKVKVKITHQWMEDLSLYLISPKGTIVKLSEKVGGDGSGYDNTVFYDGAETQIQFGASPFQGEYKPYSNLSLFKNENSVGNWSLKAVDDSSNDRGTIAEWSLEICGIPIEYELPSTNFNITAVSETCPNKNNGQIIINAASNLTYNVEMNGKTYNFSNNNLIINNLAPGSYDFCINVAGQMSKYCYTTSIATGTQLQAKTSFSETAILVEIESGTAPFIVTINNAFSFQSESSSFYVNASKGDLLQVKSAIECEGEFSKIIDRDGNVAYPNPTQDIFTIYLPNSETSVRIDLYNSLGQLVSSKQYPIIFGKVIMSIGNNPKGVYIAKVYLKKPISLKILKQ